MIISLLVIILAAFSIPFANGDAYAWGWNNIGQLGLGHNSTHQNITEVPTYRGKNIESVSWSGQYHFAKMENGDVYVTGTNGDRTLGFFTGRIPLSTQTPILNPVLRGFSELHAGFRMAAGVAENGTAFGWGYYGAYTQGGPSNEFYTPVPANPAYEITGKVAHIALNNFVIHIVLKNGTVVTAGGQHHGKLGIGLVNAIPRIHFAEMKFWNESKVPLKKILSTNTNHICAFAMNQSIFCWGENTVGQHGVGDTEDNWIPERVRFFDDNKYYVSQLVLGQNFSAALTCGGRVFVWGSNKLGQLGNGRIDNDAHPLPEEVTSLSDKNIVELVAYHSGIYARTATNDWYVWGSGDNMAHGMRHFEHVLVPTLNPHLKAVNINRVATSGNGHSFLGWYDPDAPTTRVGCPVQINECLGSHKCVATATCVDTERGYQCVCPAGQVGDGILATAGGKGCYLCPVQLANGTCISCKVGTVANEPKTACVACPPGSYNTRNSTQCIKCQGTTITFSPVVACRDCPPSTIPTADHSACVQCPPGTQRLQGESSCSPCPAGSARCANAGMCRQCARGYFAEDSGMATCRICPPGSISSSFGATSCTPCAAGTYMYAGRSSCVACPQGTTSPAGSATRHYCM